jgi:Flp pilus assembly pilin Flp
MTLEVNVYQLLGTVWREEDGQDLIEYTLLIVFVVFVTVGVISIGGASIKGIASLSGSQIAAANAGVGL